MNEVYVFMYCDCIYESAYFPKSIHRTKKGAFKAMNRYLNDRFLEHRRIESTHGKDFFKCFVNQGWVVKTYKLEE